MGKTLSMVPFTEEVIDLHDVLSRIQCSVYGLETS